MFLCSNRVSQMTKTYNDIEAVTRLLEEKEKDLELTARIGKELLSANGRLESRVSSLEGDLRSARDVITQLRHDLHTKCDLLQVLTNDSEESPVEEEPAARIGALRVRTGALERENRALREEASRLAAGADSAELAEKQLLRDIAQQLCQANAEANAYGSELAGERERAEELQLQLDSSNSRLGATERNLQQLTIEHEHTLRILEITKENQNALAGELADTKERYAEVAAHLSELQEQLRQLRKRGEPAMSARGLMPHVAAAAGLLPNSLHREMHSSVFSELSLDSGIGESGQQNSMQKIFETVANASRWADAPLSERLSVDAPDGPPAPLRPPVKPMSARSNDSVLDDCSESDSEEYPGGWGGSGVPGAPGAAELAAALRRLTPAEIDGRRALLTASHAHRGSLMGESIMSTEVSGGGLDESAVWGAGRGAWRAPRRLQIVKPLEGSLTLHTWARLARPTMSNVLEEQEGVGVRGRRGEAAARAYRLSDVEEDDDLPRLPRAHTVYTYTDSIVLHPNDGSLPGSSASSAAASQLSSLSSSVLGSAWSSLRSSRRSSLRSSRRTSAATSPTRHTRRESFCPTPAKRYTPTATPANSPLLGSPEASPPATPAPGEQPSLHSLIAIGRKYLASPAADGAAPSPLTLQTPGSLYTGMVHRSPMEQLTCLKRNLRSPAGQPAEKKDIAEAAPPLAPLAAPLGVPAQPGSGALDLGRKKMRAPRPRTDLGTVGATPVVVAQSPLGTISTFLFGRKGGLL